MNASTVKIHSQKKIIREKHQNKLHHHLKIHFLSWEKEIVSFHRFHRKQGIRRAAYDFFHLKNDSYI